MSHIMTRNWPRSYNTICFYRFLWWSVDPGWSVSQDYPALGCFNARTVDRSLYTASLLSHTRVVDRPQLCCHLTLGGGRVLPRLQHWLLHWVAVARWVSGALTAEMLSDSTNSSQAKQNINIYMHVLKCQYVWIQIWGLYRKPNIFM